MEISKHQKTALVFGGSGLVGGFVLRQLLAHPSYKRVISFGRRKLDVEGEGLEQHIINFDEAAEYQHLMQGQDVFSCLGTTMAKAGSKAAFYKVDYTYAYETAKAAAEAGANQLLLVSSVGADPDSLFFYSRVKGELEAAIRELPFWGIHIFEPSLLLGPRQEQRLGEQLAVRLTRGIAPFFRGNVMGKYRPVEAEDVAKAMIAVAQGLQPGQIIYDSEAIHELANAGTRLLR
ncbi:MAG: NAD(P)H-binding protein [Phaeodactylibacter sp.]|uniref:NAD(P)H-binding protein n=1 Tax=Phaeodactylibacter sp. TaxID=1940289 RepID=UPI0032EB6714